jgi:hypothetical protein
LVGDTVGKLVGDTVGKSVGLPGKNVGEKEGKGETPG